MCYNKIYLGKTLYKRVDSYEQVHVSVNTIVIMGEGWGVSTKSLKEICKTFDCRFKILLIMYWMKTMYKKTNCKEYFLCGARTVI